MNRFVITALVIALVQTGCLKDLDEDRFDLLGATAAAESGPEALGCLELNECLRTCNTESACQRMCIGAAAPLVLDRYQDIWRCSATHRCRQREGADSRACIVAECLEQLLACGLDQETAREQLADEDPCAVEGRYGDGACDAQCAEPDPDCSAASDMGTSAPDTSPGAGGAGGCHLLL